MAQWRILVLHPPTVFPREELVRMVTTYPTVYSAAKLRLGLMNG